MGTLENNDIDMAVVLAEKVRAGEPIYVTGPLTGVAGELHVAMINRLREMTGMPVYVIHN